MCGLTQCHSQDKKAWRQFTQCHLGTCILGGSSHTSYSHPFLSPPEDHKPSFQVPAKTAKHEEALGVTEGILSDQGSPGTWVSGSLDHDLNVSPHPFPAGSPHTFITQLQEKAARPDDLSAADEPRRPQSRN